jgi:hypothetical protein
MLQYSDLSDAAAAAVARQLDLDASLSGGTDGGLLNERGTFGFVWADYPSSSILVKGKDRVRDTHTGCLQLGQNCAEFMQHSFT